MNAIEIHGLCKAYPGFQLENLELTLPQGCILGLVGENGAGKSTTIKLMLDMIQKDKGSIFLLGQDNQKNFSLTKEDIGVVLDEVGIPGCLHPLQVGKIMGSMFRNWDESLYRSYLQRFSLPEKKKFSDFSRGMKMKLGIAVALSHGAKLLILDEATSGLDPVVRDEILDIFNEFTRDETHSILLSSHIVSDLEKICDYVAFLHKGKLLLYEEVDALRQQYGLLHCTADQLQALPEDSIVGKKLSPYGAQVLVKRQGLPEGLSLSPVDIEQLFIFMTKEDRRL